MRVITWNINFGFDSTGYDPGDYNLTTQASEVAALNPDILILNEADINRSRSNNDDQPAVIAAACGLNHRYYNNAAGVAEPGGGGNSIISRYRLFYSTTASCEESHLFADQIPVPNPTRGFCIGRFYLDGVLFSIVGAHLDGDNDTTRIANIDEIDGLIGDKAIICGDFNSLPASATYAHAITKWADQTDGLGVDSTQVDYIFTKGLTGTGGFSAASGTSDHRLYYVDFT